MDEKKKGFNVSLDHSEPVFFTDNATVSHSSNKFIIDFTQMTPRFDSFEDKHQQTFVIKHKTLVLDPQFAKIFSDILQQNIKRYEKNFGAIKLPKQKISKEKVEKVDATRYIG
jgi:TPP-dependent indolepyruvate ferredoxin oxidoreductase alpha subunit